MRPINPFHIYPVYSYDNDISLLGHYLVPTRRAHSMQFNLPGVLTVSDFSFVTTTGSVIAQATSEISTYETSTGRTFYWTNGNFSLVTVANGTSYRPRITMSNGAIYWGHLCCASFVFDDNYPELEIGFCTPDGLAGVINFTSPYPLGAAVQITLTDNNSAFETELSAFGGSIDSTLLTADGSSNISANIVVSIFISDPNGGSRTITSVYTLAANNSDVCGTVNLTKISEDGSKDLNVFELTAFNSKDVISQGIYYGGGFRQKLWFHGYFAQPIPLLDENYLANGQGDEFFQSARTAEAQVLDFWPCVDRAGLGLSYLKYSDNITLLGAGLSNSLYRLGFEFVPVENEDRPKGRITAEFEGAFVQAIIENYEPA